ncbi:hypothetical protein FOC84_06535 [Achromobacter pestifer]|uniref:DUF2591 family protein n=1 Tax=Achromobacter pestifer TaxID=1353889 RepID=A0A7D4E2L4_9BURK|nr:hypothetical protein [Achromobacter pestifer]QKH34626.1 hypothetical protein FOC84_06535 [Achromobacter pestifer]
MRTDRELLELAARANWAQEVADDEISLRYCEINDGILYLHADNQDHNGRDREFVWNPLTDDGDALRLAVKLSLRVEARPDGHIYVWSGEYLIWRDFAFNEHVDHEREAAMRRAIVNTAAEIGAHPKQHNDGGAE